jgi:hypothetical protein
MTTDATQTSIRSDVVVDAAQDRAFKLFTEQFDKIKPREHNMLGVDIAESVFEPHAGGGSTTAASMAANASGVAFSCANRLSGSCSRGTSARTGRSKPISRASEVEIRFLVESAERTRVELEHRHLDRHGDGWEGLRGGVEGDDGWPLYLARYAAQVEAST